MPLRRTASLIVSSIALLFASHAALAAGERVVVGFVDSSAPGTPTQSAWDGAAWSVPGAATASPGTITWQCLAPCPTRLEVASLAVASNKAVNLTLWNGTTWDATSQLTSNAGKKGAQVAAAAYEATSGELLAVYRKAKDKQVYYRTYSTASPSEQVFAMALDAPPTLITLVPKPGSNDILMLVRSTARLYAAVWNGSGFGNQITLDTSVKAGGRAVAAGYTTASGQALVVWAGKTGDPKYRVWNGSGWLAQGAITGANKPVGWVALAANPLAASNEALVAWMDKNKDISACAWNGSAWGARLVVETGVVSHTQQRLDLAYQPDGAKAVLAWHRAGNSVLRYRVWTGGAWSIEGSGPNMVTETTSIKFASGPRTNEVTMTARRKAATPLVTDYTLYSQSGSVNEGTADVNGPVGQSVAGVVVPTAPPGTAGAVDLTYAAGAVATIPPGNYKNLTTAANCTLSLTAGTYVFRAVTLGANTTITADTASGDTNIIVTTSGWSAADGLSLLPADADDEGQLKLHVNAGDCTIEKNAVVAASLLYVYNGKFSIDDNADLTALVFAKNNITLSTGSAEPSEALTPSGSFLGAPWLNGSAGAVSTVCMNVQGNAGTDDLCYLGARARVRVASWREVGQDE